MRWPDHWPDPAEVEGVVIDENKGSCLLDFMGEHGISEHEAITAAAVSLGLSDQNVEAVQYLRWLADHLDAHPPDLETLPEVH